MSRTVIARRYANALFELAREKGELDRVEQELNQVVETLERTPELQEWLAAPAVDVERKKALVAEQFQALSDWTKNLFFLLLDRGRQGLISRIAEEYKHLADEARGVAEAVVTSAFPLTEKEKEELAAVFQDRLGKKLRITNVVDSDLLGGLIVQIGDRLYDGSLKTKLIRFRQKLTGSRVG
ncbi:ATP synthase F1 subcomplex delta subunit [Planifilum fimeticola]|jgi:F-type H+-transporting ATPase subunit delta|uniref:ATP synthase subunit delta n=1 Tax=Planifilum fimeticola TaxID=201975 RepID=A0A2T0LHY0_9BACL|nr:F0F1 ATP synthase subunit delta [Planifilum fimeticola]PRX42020.1 ATP synthase F1 subcomplex delta subunit [Planifilum fimeticola]